MWAEVSPGGSELWTSSGRDLLAYDATAIAPGAPAPLRPVRRLAGRGPAVGRDGGGLLPRAPVPRRPGRRRAAAVVGRRDRRHAPGARARAARRGGRVGGPRCPRRARRSAALAAVAVPARRREAHLRDRAQRAADLRPGRARAAAGARGAGARRGGPQGAPHRDGDPPLRRARAPRRGRPREHRHDARADGSRRRRAGDRAPVEAGLAARHGDQGAARPARASLVVRAR